MELTIDQALQKGIEAHRAGNLQEAEALYQAILRAQPAHPDANHNLGVLAVAVNRSESALELFKAALESNPKQEQFWISYVDALIRERQFVKAKQVLEQGRMFGIAGEKFHSLEAQITSLIQTSDTESAQESQKQISSNAIHRTSAESEITKETSSMVPERKSIDAPAPAPAQKDLDSLSDFYQKGLYNDAVSLASSITTEFPRHHFGWKVLTVALRQMGRMSESLVAGQKTVEQFPHDAEVHANLASTLAEVGRLEDAEASFQMAIALSPGYVQAHYNMGNTMNRLGKLEEASACYRQAIELSPDYAQAHYNLGVTLQGLSNFHDAEAAYREAIALKPDFAEAYGNLGVALQEQGQFEDAEVSYKKAILMKTDYVEAYINLGNTLKALGSLQDAEANYRKAISFNPSYAQAHYNLGIALHEVGRLEDAKESYEKAIALKADFAELHCNLGNTLKELGRIEDAKDRYLKAIMLRPDYAEAHSNLGTTLQELGSLEDAEASYIKAIELKPDFAAAHSNLGNIFQEQGKLEDAAASYKKAIELKSDFVEAYSNLGNTLKEIGRYDEAESSYARALSLHPGYAQVHYNLGIMLYERKSFKKAAEHFKQSSVKKSKSYLLRCLYLLDEKSDFYDQLDYLRNLGETNAVIGSLSSRSKLKYGIDRPNPFCKKPLEYVLKTDLTEKYDFSSIFVETAKNILTDQKVSTKTQGHLSNGRQTAGNLFALRRGLTEEIERIIHIEIIRYREYFTNSEEGLIKSWPTDYSLFGWLVSMKSGGELRPHMHDTGWITGSIYINVPPKSKTNSGNLVVCIDDEEYVNGENGTPKSIIDVVTGNLCLFPSSLLHYTIPFESEEERIVLAFDVVPKTGRSA
jgi:tetratricopeptide (TPR) repeat protein